MIVTGRRRHDQPAGRPRHNEPRQTGGRRCALARRLMRPRTLTGSREGMRGADRRVRRGAAAARTLTAGGIGATPRLSPRRPATGGSNTRRAVRERRPVDGTKRGAVGAGRASPRCLPREARAARTCQPRRTHKLSGRRPRGAQERGRPPSAWDVHVVSPSAAWDVRVVGRQLRESHSLVRRRPQGTCDWSAASKRHSCVVGHRPRRTRELVGRPTRSVLASGWPPVRRDVRAVGVDNVGCASRLAAPTLGSCIRLAVDQVGGSCGREWTAWDLRCGWLPNPLGQASGWLLAGWNVPAVEDELHGTGEPVGRPTARYVRADDRWRGERSWGWPRSRGARQLVSRQPHRSCARLASQPRGRRCGQPPTSWGRASRFAPPARPPARPTARPPDRPTARPTNPRLTDPD
ncbi:hypothetical protein CLV71_117195 [Actinophytocola oryzae]|uniref:Uncharacterized protein n=1 Tax=Actinophytocola oryzae TaxID=502181 RepID=A0A4R7V0D8_9PSEU|nr:hypothetical protein CLV71_117195 [Actinophytocola oryzae]